MREPQALREPVVREPQAPVRALVRLAQGLARQEQALASLPARCCKQALQSL